jgi:hypothetical protein
MASARSRWSAAATCLMLCLVPLPALVAFAPSDHYGRVTFSGVPVPGATVTATLGDERISAVTDQDGVYRLAGLADGVWTIRVEMPGFSSVTRQISVGSGASPSSWELTMLPFEDIMRGAPPPSRRAPVQAGATRPPIATAGRPLAEPPKLLAVEDVPSTVVNAAAADGFLVNGSVNNAAASPFSQPAAFGNNRPSPGSVYNGSIGGATGNSALDARPFSFTSNALPRHVYSDVHLVGTFGGPLRFLHLQQAPTFFVGYQHTVDHNASTQSALVPSMLERRGDFSQTRDGLARPVAIVDPATGLPFPGGVIPPDRVSPQAAALLGYYPQPNLDTDSRFNYQAPVRTGVRQDSFQTRIIHRVNPRNQISGSVAYQRTATDATTLFGFDDASQMSALDGAVVWLRRITQQFGVRLRYEFIGQTTSVTPYFANRTNVSGEAGINGNNQEPANWGPPSLVFSNGIEPLTDASPQLVRSRANIGAAEGYVNRGRHNLTFGGEARRNRLDLLSQQNPRGTFSFTSNATGFAFADFLLGLPSTSSIAFGDEGRYFDGASYAAYFTDDFRTNARLTLNLGVRWDYEAPMTERFGRLANLDVEPGFIGIAPVTGNAPIGPLTGQSYSAALLRPDRTGIQPRLAMTWRPVPGSSLAIRAGYGIYRNTSAYPPIVMLLAQQPPFSKTLSVESTVASRLSLADGFAAQPSSTANTFAVDPDFRIGYAHNWQVSVQRDLRASLTFVATYSGTKGSHLIQQVLPNTYPAGADNPCPACPTGWVYLTSNGTSSRHAASVLVRRRLRGGLTASVQYTLAKAIDDAAAFAGTGPNSPAAASGPTVSLAGPVPQGLAGASIAQNWLDPHAELGSSTFDQRHLLAVQVQYTTGIGPARAAGLHGRLLNGWTVTSQLTTGSGLPMTPVYLAPITGTGVIGVRPDFTGESTGAVSPGYYLNPAAFAPPAPGHWGEVGRGSVRGPAQFALDAGVARLFAWRDRYSFEWRVDVTNALNRVTYSRIDTIVGSPQFGLPNLANPMRKVRISMRVRY